MNLSSTTPTRSGYIFLGWAKSNAAAAGELLPEGEYTTNASATLYAVWKSVSAFSPVAYLPSPDFHEYALYDDAVSWKDAEYLCEQNGGHLVTITSAEENEHIKLLMANGNGVYYCIGATDENQEGTFRWITGEPWSYSKWDDREPNNYGGNYGIIYSTDAHAGYWDDIWDWICRGRGFICEIEPIDIFSVSYNANGGSGAPPIQYKKDKSIILSSVIPVRMGYTFLGWAESAAAVLPDYMVGATYSGNKDISLYAVWREDLTVGVDTSINSATVNISGADLGSIVVLAQYKGAQMTNVQIKTYNNAQLAFDMTAGYDVAKVMVLDKSYRPLCAPVLIE